jgi:glycosyltransferase involved in cell wall biosynthesis
LSNAGYSVTLVGRQLKSSLPLSQRSYQQKRLTCFFNDSFLFYLEYNLRLFVFLLGEKMGGICAIDLDTILPCLFISKLKGIRRVYDAHEYFTELKEVRTRPFVRKIWKGIEDYAVPQFRYGYTVSQGLADEFYKSYGRNYPVIRNVPLLIQSSPPAEREDFIVYQGAVNEARGFEYLIPAMKKVNYKLVICGDGNFMDKLKQLIRQEGVEEKVVLKGMMLPEQLRLVAEKASLGIGLAEKEGINQFHALPNKFLEYMHAGLPQLAMNFPEYQKINSEYKVAILLDSLEPSVIADTINEVMEDKTLLRELSENAVEARKLFCWQKEEKHLIDFYQTIFQ